MLCCLNEFNNEREAGFSTDTQTLQEETRVLYADLMTLLDEMRAKPYWKVEKDSTLKKKLEKFVFKI